MYVQGACPISVTLVQSGTTGGFLRFVLFCFLVNLCRVESPSLGAWHSERARGKPCGQGLPSLWPYPSHALCSCFCAWQLPSHPLTPSSKHADSKPVALTPAYHTLPHSSHHGTPHTTISWGPLEPPKTPKPWSLSCLRPAPPLRPSAALCYKEVRSCSTQTAGTVSTP